VVFLVSEVERNVYDQRGLEYHIYENQRHVKVIRRTLQQIRTGGSLSPSKTLIVLVMCFTFSVSIQLTFLVTNTSELVYSKGRHVPSIKRQLVNQGRMRF